MKKREDLIGAIARHKADLEFWCWVSRQPDCPVRESKIKINIEIQKNIVREKTAELLELEAFQSYKKEVA